MKRDSLLVTDCLLGRSPDKMAVVSLVVYQKNSHSRTVRGLWVGYHDNGQWAYKQTFKNGKKEGLCVRYYKPLLDRRDIQKQERGSFCHVPQKRMYGPKVPIRTVRWMVLLSATKTES